MREGLLGDGRAADLHALGVAHELRRRVERRGEALPRQDGGREAARGRLSVGAGDLHALEREVGVAELGEHVLHGLEQGLDPEAQRPVQDVERLVVRNLRNLERQLVHSVSLATSSLAYLGAYLGYLGTGPF